MPGVLLARSARSLAPCVKFAQRQSRWAPATHQLLTQISLADPNLACRPTPSSAGLLSPTAPQVVVIAATNRPDDVDPAVLRRLPLSFQIDLPAVSGRTDVLRLLLKDEPLAAEVDLHAVAEATEGYSGSDLDQLCKTAAMRALDEALEQEAAAAEGGAGPSAGRARAANTAAGAPATPAASTALERQRAATSRAAAGGGVAGGGGGGSSAASEVTVVETPLTLRKLTLDDFLRARMVVRPTRGRFHGVSHEVHASPVPNAPVNEFDAELYD